MAVDAFLAIASRREIRSYADRPLPADVQHRILEAGRTAQNMLLAAWNEGVGSCPNAMPDRAAAAGVLGLAEGEEPVIVLSFGYPSKPRDPEGRSAEDWVTAANRKPFDEVVSRI